MHTFKSLPRAWAYCVMKSSVLSHDSMPYARCKYIGRTRSSTPVMYCEGSSTFSTRTCNERTPQKCVVRITTSYYAFNRRRDKEYHAPPLFVGRALRYRALSKEPAREFRDYVITRFLRTQVTTLSTTLASGPFRFLVASIGFANEEGGKQHEIKLRGYTDRGLNNQLKSTSHTTET